MNRRKFVFLPFSILLVLCGAVFAAQDQPAPISFIPLWKPQAQFAGYYVALEKGMYRARGLEVDILEGGPDKPPEALLEDGRADFGVMWLSSAVRRRSQGLDLVNIGQIVQRSALMLIARKSSGIRTPQDIAGKKVSLWQGDLQVQPLAFLRQHKVEARIVPQYYSVDLFLLGGVEVVSAMWYNEYHTILNAGLDPDELTVFFFKDYNLNFPEDGIYCLRRTLDKDPRAAAAFVAASLDGWAYAFAHPEEAVDIVLRRMQQAHIPANRVHQRWMLDRMKDCILPSGSATPVAGLAEADYRRVGQELIDSGLIAGSAGYADFYRPPTDQP